MRWTGRLTNIKNTSPSQKIILFLFLLLISGSIIIYNFTFPEENEEMKELTFYTLPEGNWEPHTMPDGETVYTKVPDWTEAD